MAGEELKARFQAARGRMPESPDIDPVLDGDTITFWLGRRPATTKLINGVCMRLLWVLVCEGLFLAISRLSTYFAFVPLVLAAALFPGLAVGLQRLLWSGRRESWRYWKCFAIDTCPGSFTVWRGDPLFVAALIDEIAFFLYSGTQVGLDSFSGGRVFAVTHSNLVYHLHTYSVRELDRLSPMLQVMADTCRLPVFSSDASDAELDPTLGPQGVHLMLKDRERLVGRMKLIYDPEHQGAAQPALEE